MRTGNVYKYIIYTILLVVLLSIVMVNFSNNSMYSNPNFLYVQYDNVLNSIKAEIKKSFELPHSVFVLKIINADLNVVTSTNE